MRLFEKLGDESVHIDGQTFPAPSLVEDDDGYRFLLLQWEADRFPIEAWLKAHAQGARAIVAPSSKERWAAVRTEDFIERKVEHAADRTYSLPEVEYFDGFPSVNDLYRNESGEPEEAKGTFVHLHSHSEASALDGLSNVEEMVATVKGHGQHAIALTDHGICSGHFQLQKACEAEGIKPIFGQELNLVNDRHNKESDQRYEYWHLILWAMDDDGLRNLWAINTEANRDGFYGRPRADWGTLKKFNKGVMASTACLRGPVSRAIMGDDIETARMLLGQLVGIFDDRLYVEIQTNEIPEQRKVNETLVDLAREQNLPIIAAVDSHYAEAEDREHHKIWIAVQTNKDLTDEAELFTGNTDYHLMSEAEVRGALGYLPDDVVDEAIANTVKVTDRCSAHMEGEPEPPVFSKADTHEEAVEKDIDRLLKVCLSNWSKCEGNSIPESEYVDRFEREFKLLIDKGYVGYFLMVSDYCRWAREHGILVGPGRGSGAASLVSYLCGITGIDPLEADLLFERFLTAGRKALPDFDVDFPASKRQELTDYITDRYGEKNVVRVGTHIRVKNKSVIRDMARVLKSDIDIHFPDINKVSELIDEAEADSAGLGMSWEDLWDEHGEVLAPYRDKYPKLFHHADKIVGRLRTYGKHAAGVVIAPDANLTESLPLRVQGKDDTDMIAEFDMDSLEELGFIKFDLLTLRTLDTIQQTVDTIREETGEVIDPWEWKDEYDDPEVWDEISAGHTLGMFQIETAAGIRTCKRFQPRSLSDLSAVITLVRPGPVRSGLTETYFQRRMGNEAVTYLDDRMEPILYKTEGCMIYQEQVMKLTMELAGYDETEADYVRKILGKKKVELVEEEGKKFVERALGHDTDEAVATTIWEQMAEFSRYSFNLAHAYGYAMLGYWTGYLKVKYPQQFLAACMSTVDKGRIPEFINEARRMGFKVLPPDINDSGKGFKGKDDVIRYGFDGVKGIGKAAVEALMEGQPYESYDDFMERKGKKANVGVVKLLAQLGAFESIEPGRRRELEERLEWEAEGKGKHCEYMTVFDVAGRKTPENVGCTFDWENEPRELTKTGQKKKRKPVPKSCTVRCRQFTPITFTPSEDDFTKREVMSREMELLGIHLTHTMFDTVPPEMWNPEWGEREIGVPILVGSQVQDAPLGDHLTIAVLNRLRPHTAKNGKKMGFSGFQAVDTELDVTIFNTQWRKFHKDLIQGELYLCQIHKNERGLSLVHLEPL